MSFHWGWFLRYKLSQPQHRHPSWAHPRHLPLANAAAVVPAAFRPAKPRQNPPSRLLLHHAVRPQTPARHTAYPLSPADSGGSGRLSVRYGVSRASYIFSGCITLHPRTPSAPSRTVPLSPSPRRSPPCPSLAPTPLYPRVPPCDLRAYHRSSIAPVFPRARAAPAADETSPGRALNSNYGAVFETD